MKWGVSEITKCGTFVVASCQFASVTPKASSIISERNHPGLIETEVAPCGASSWACAQAMRVTATFARSVIDEDVKATLLVADAIDQLSKFAGDEMIHLDSDTIACCACRT